VDVDQFYGLEISEWPSLIAEVAMWLLDHQMNLLVSETFGERLVRLPLKKSPRIRCDNALRLDWKLFLPPTECSYVLGNPPFVGKTYQTGLQKADMELICGDVPAFGLLDFVTAWYFKAAEYIQGTRIRCAFVSTNSITQGEQVGLLWNHLFQHYGIKIHFAHRTFSWMSEARGKAQVHVVIIGFGAYDQSPKRIYDYETDADKVSVSEARNISPYLVEGNDSAVVSRSSAICAVPDMVNGNKQVDGGFLTLDAAEKDELVRKYPELVPFVRPFLGSEEFINGGQRWCLWLVDAPPDLLGPNEELRRRLEGVRDFRLKSKKPKTRESAKTPMLFGEIRPITTNFLAIPEVSSERRNYIPIGFFSPSVVPSNKLQVVPEATLWHFGVLTSAMHMAWMRQVTGRLESRYSYSAKIVYNNFPWPVNVSAKDRASVEVAAQAVLNARKQFPDSTLATLYNPLNTPPVLTKAHTALDRAVDRCYRKEPFPSDRARVEHLFALYEQLTAPLIPAAAKPRSRRRKEADPGSAPDRNRLLTSAATTAPAPNSLQAEMDAAHFYSVKEEPSPYRTGQDT